MRDLVCSRHCDSDARLFQKIQRAVLESFCARCDRREPRCAVFRLDAARPRKVFIVMQQFTVRRDNHVQYSVSLVRV